MCRIPTIGIVALGLRFDLDRITEAEFGVGTHHLRIMDEVNHLNIFVVIRRVVLFVYFEHHCFVQVWKSLYQCIDHLEQAGIVLLEVGFDRDRKTDLIHR